MQKLSFEVSLQVVKTLSADHITERNEPVEFFTGYDIHTYYIESMIGYAFEFV